MRWRIAKISQWISSSLISLEKLRSKLQANGRWSVRRAPRCFRRMSLISLNDTTAFDSSQRFMDTIHWSSPSFVPIQFYSRLVFHQTNKNVLDLYSFIGRKIVFFSFWIQTDRCNLLFRNGIVAKLLLHIAEVESLLYVELARLMSRNILLRILIFGFSFVLFLLRVVPRVYSLSHFRSVFCFSNCPVKFGVLSTSPFSLVHSSSSQFFLYNTVLSSYSFTGIL